MTRDNQREERILIDSAASPDDPVGLTSAAIEQEAIPDDAGVIKAGRLAGKSMSQVSNRPLARSSLLRMTEFL